MFSEHQKHESKNKKKTGIERTNRSREDDQNGCEGGVGKEGLGGGEREAWKRK
jgi:hypothetical protein